MVHASLNGIRKKSQVPIRNIMVFEKIHIIHKINLKKSTLFEQLNY